LFSGRDSAASTSSSSSSNVQTKITRRADGRLNLFVPLENK